MTSPSKQAFISWCLDVSSSATALVLLVAWISDLQSSHPSLLSKSFFENGFCLSPRFFDDTHFSCSIFNAFCGLCCIGAILTGQASSSAASGVAAYFFSHGYGHYIESSNELAAPGSAQEEVQLQLQDTIILAAILSIGPLRVSSFLVEANKITQTYANGMVALTLASLVAVYAFFIKRPCYSLLYINSNPTHTIYPQGFAGWFQIQGGCRHSFIQFLLAGRNCPSVCEPLYCDSFVANIGGHFIFDVSLAVGTLVSLVQETKDGRKKDAEKAKTT